MNMNEQMIREQAYDCGTTRVEATNSGSLQEPNSNATRR